MSAENVLKGKNKWGKRILFLASHILLPIAVSVPASIWALRWFAKPGEIPADPISIAGVYIGYTTLIFTIMSVALVVISIYFAIILSDKKEYEHAKVTSVVQEKLCTDNDFKKNIINLIMNNDSFRTDFIDQLVASEYFKKCVTGSLQVSFGKPEPTSEKDVDDIRGKIK
ncbi:hypothetical protein [Akkermansia sp.]|uniref:hypothetical protein n=1 Tax=Akkermansia sp. TaxID=1872421 RepID=UPI0025B9308B|nr:hypothetical protein [Akkermansia sp.]MCD8064344.1 hypothetical protein [Akkermansia sp.]